MNGALRIAHAGMAAFLRHLAGPPLSFGGGLVGWAGWHERRSRPAGDERARPGDRRSGETFDFDFSREAHGFGFSYTATIGRGADGRINEVFVDCHKVASEKADEALAIAHLISLALQHGMPVATLARTASRFEDGRPCTLIGRIADLLAEAEGLPAAPPVPTPLPA